MTDSLTFVSGVALAVAFGWAAASKLAGFERWRRALSGYSLPGGFESVARFGTPVLEIAAVVLVLTGPLEVAGALVLALISGFCIVVLRARAAQGDRLPCGCFGGTSERDYRLMLIRNAALAVPAGVLTLAGGNGMIARLGSVAASDVLPLVLVLLAAALIMWMTMGLMELLTTRPKPSRGNRS
jgi:hypothetical protein